MRALLNSISFEQLLWLIPIFLTIHTIEEHPSFYAFRRALDKKIISWAQFRVLLVITPFAKVIITFLSLQSGEAFEETFV